MRKALGRSASRKRSTITDRCAIANVTIAPNANTPARNTMSSVSARPNPISPAITMTTNGVPRLRWSRPARLGICRFVASE